MLPKRQPSDPEPLPAASAVVEVWDLPLRIFHWVLVALLIAAVVSGKIGGNAMDTHLKTGYCITVLLVFRILWGFVGSHHARFVSFVRGIRCVAAYCRKLIRGEAHAECGHNPLGGWMVIVMLTVLAIQACTGWFANDDIMSEGPLAAMVDKDMSDYLTVIHKLNFEALAVLAGMHVLAIGFYLLVKKTNLIRPMISGRAEVTPEQALSCPPISRYTNLGALALLIVIAAGFYLLIPAA